MLQIANKSDETFLLVDCDDFLKSKIALIINRTDKRDLKVLIMLCYIGSCLSLGWTLKTIPD